MKNKADPSFIGVLVFHVEGKCTMEMAKNELTLF